MSTTPARPKGNWIPAGIRRDERQGSIFHSYTSSQDVAAEDVSQWLVVMALELLAEGSVQVQFIINTIISFVILMESTTSLWVF